MNDSILLIQSKQSDNGRMGTGFVVHQDSLGSYVLTCLHVVNDVVEPKIENFDVEIKNNTLTKHIDLALLYVKGLFKTPLELEEKKCINKEVELIGYSNFSTKIRQVKPRAAHILDAVKLTNIKDNKEVNAWQIIADDHSEIEAGNSGSPLFCKETGKVMAVVSNNKGVKQGYAISIEHLKDIWENMPPLLLEGNDASPFVGLSAFSIEESHLFFGRDKETQKIIERLKKQDLVAVVGDSGSGKSSVIKAGIIPKYLNGVLNVEEESQRVFHLIEMRPATNPFKDLSNSLNHIDEVFDFKLEDMMFLKEVLESKDAKNILNAFQSLFRKDEVTLLLYIDQFEELFTLCEKELEKEFISLLLHLLENQSSKLKIKIVFTMRRDYYNLIAEYESFFKQTQASKYTLRRMKNEQIKECIEKPLAKTSIALEQISAFSKAVLQDMGEESSELTLLQIALTQTWKHKNEYDNNLLRTYHEIGEVSGALAKLADDTWQILSPVEQRNLQYIFIRIIKSNETGDVTRRLAKKNEFSDEAWLLAQKLSSALDYEGESAHEKNAQLGRLLKIKGEKGKVLELSHEALIKQWPKYQVWLKKVSKDNLKRTHDYVIGQNQIYQKQKQWIKLNFLLSGYELERSKKLLGDEYREYLSEDEISYIKKSIWYKRFRWGMFGLAVSVILGLAGFLAYANEKLYESNVANKVISNQLESLVSKSIDRAIAPLIEDPINPKDINFSNDIFTVVVDNFKLEKDKEELVIVSWFGLAKIYKYKKQNKEANHTYLNIIKHFKDSKNPKVLDYVARSWYNQGKLFEEVDKEKASHIYLELIRYFKKSKNPKVLKKVAEAWLNKGLLFTESISQRKESIEVLEDFLEHFKKNSSVGITKQTLEVYNTLSMLNLLNGRPHDALFNIEQGYQFKEDYVALNLNLFNAYIFLERIEDAKKIYDKNIGRSFNNKTWKQSVFEDITLFQKNNINSIYFNEVLNW